MSQLGFTFYPKDWWTSDSFYTLNAYERYIYLELLFMMYDNGGSIKSSKVIVERRLLTTIKDDVWVKITDLMVKDGDQITHQSVNKRLRKVVSNRENGKRGGAPKGNKNAIKQPKQPKKTTQNNPPLEIEIEIEREREREVETEEEGNRGKPPPTQKKFLKPTIEELVDYFSTKNFEKKLNWPAQKILSTAEKFFNFYESKGWMIGKNKMKDWRAAVSGQWLTEKNWNNGTNRQNTGFLAGRDVPTDKL